MKKTHNIPENAKNSDVLQLIREYVRLDRDQNILIDHWFRGLSFYALSNKYGLTLTAIKRIIYTVGDRVLLKLN